MQRLNGDRGVTRAEGVFPAALIVLAALQGGYCRPTPAIQLPPPHVTVTRPVEREVMEWDEYTARLQATEEVEVRARVSGYLQSIHFRDGAMVKKGDLLFTIDPRPYEAAQRRAEGEHAVSQARLELAKKKAERAVAL